MVTRQDFIDFTDSKVKTILMTQGFDFRRERVNGEVFNNRISLNFTGKSRRPVRRHFTAHFDRDNVATRQISLQNMYSRLAEMAEVLYSVNFTPFLDDSVYL